MSEHVPSERLVAYVDGELADAAERAAIAAHLEACVVCKMDHDALRALDTSVAVAGAQALVASVEQPAGESLDAKLQELAHAALTGASCKIVHASADEQPAAVRRPRLTWWPLLATAAAALLAWTFLFRDDVAQRLSVQASAHDAPGTVRGPERRLWSLEVRSSGGGFPAILAIGKDGAKRLVYPDPNPVLAELQAGCAVPAGIATRVPKEPVFDLELGSAETEVLVVIRKTAWDREALGRLASGGAATEFGTLEQARVPLPVSGR